ncbi:acetylglutamate kinase [Thorsellia kenyensis]|uniref:Acetylglutamate kinase n=1 Tax=Thorsellia kenyensis TaxID=1549888 RepID=A0ABV6CCI8_9GAMM
MQVKTPLVLKLGGVILDTPGALDSLFSTIQGIWDSQVRQSESKRPVVIVHGGGCVVDFLMKQLNLPIVKKEGLRVTPSSQIDIVAGALSGTANKNIMAHAINAKLMPVGLSLGDATIAEVTPISDELGHVAHATAGSGKLLTLLLSHGYLPIISSIGITADGLLMNVNADEAAVVIAKSIGGSLALLADVSGVLDENKKLIPSMNRAQANELIDKGVITDGMVVKVNAALDAASNLGGAVTIASFKDFDKLPLLFKNQSMGTLMIP